MKQTTKRVLMPPAYQRAAEALNLSPGIISGDHVFLTGATGGDAAGRMPGPEAQFETIFDKIAAVLAEADLTLDAVVEMTSYHVGLRAHFDLFDEVRLRCFSPPYPAWTAVEVAALRREGAVAEVRVIAQIGAR